DASAKFLESHPKLKSCSNEVKELRIQDDWVELGTRIYPAEPEKIIAERVVAIRLKRKPASQSALGLTISHACVKHARVSLAQPQGNEDWYLFIPMKSASRYVGKEFFFLPGKGYWPL